MRFKIDWANLIVGRKFTVFALFYLVFEGNFQVQAPGGLYMEGRFNGRFFALQVWGAYIWKGLIHGGAYFRNFMVFWRCSLCFLFTPKTLCMNIDFKLRKQPSFRDVTTCFPAK